MKKFITTYSMILTLSFGSVVSGIAEAARYAKYDGFSSSEWQKNASENTKSTLLSDSEYLDLADRVVGVRRINAPKDLREEFQLQKDSLSQQDYIRLLNGVLYDRTAARFRANAEGAQLEEIASAIMYADKEARVFANYEPNDDGTLNVASIVYLYHYAQRAADPFPYTYSERGKSSLPQLRFTPEIYVENLVIDEESQEGLDDMMRDEFDNLGGQHDSPGSPGGIADTIIMLNLDEMNNDLEEMLQGFEAIAELGKVSGWGTVLRVLKWVGGQLAWETIMDCASNPDDCLPEGDGGPGIGGATGGGGLPRSYIMAAPGTGGSEAGPLGGLPPWILGL